MQRIFIIALVLSASMGAMGADPTLDFTGSGTAEDPWLLQTGADIRTLAKACEGDAGATSGMNAGHYQGNYFAVANDIDMSGITDFYGIGTAPVGSSPGISWYFAGVIDGRGHTISNMNIDGIVYDESGKALAAGKTGSRGYVGFIGVLKNGGGVQDLHFDNTCTIKGATESGSVVGHLDADCKVLGCTSAATVYNLKKNSGGIVGYAKGSASKPAFIFNCVFKGAVKECTEATGGICGRNERAVISKCVNLGSVEAQSFNSFTVPDKQNQGGGIAGYNYFGTIENCMNAGPVTVSNQKAGGIVAYNSNMDCDVHSCINLGRLITKDAQYIGAIVGHNFQSGSGSNIKHAKISDCYYDAQMWGDPALITGYRVDPSWVTALPTFEFTTAGTLEGLPSEHWVFEQGFYPRVGTALSAAEIKEAAATYVLFRKGENAMDFTTSASISTALPGIMASMETGRWFKIENGTITAEAPEEAVSDVIELTAGSYRLDIPVMKVPVTFEGSGTEEDPYLISEKKHLFTLAERCNSDRMEHFDGVWFRQTADIDMEHDAAFKGIASKCINAFNSEHSYYFSGNYDGDGFTISNLDIEGVTFRSDGTAYEYTAGSTGNVGLFGALGAGARISRVNIRSSRISGYYNVGGITGYMPDNAEITDCHVNAEIVCYNRIAGGIVGQSNAEAGATSLKINGCSFSGSVKANNEIAGGIVGYNHAIVDRCVNSGSITVENFNGCVPSPKLVEAGGIAGCNGGDITDCINFGNVCSEWTEAGGITGYNTNGFRKGNLIRNLNVGRTDASDLSYAGSIVGLDYRITTSSSSELIIKDNYYDSTVCGLHASGNIDKDGLAGLPTDLLVSGETIGGLPDKWTFRAGYYPVPTGLEENEEINSLSATYLICDAPWTLYNFGTEALIPTVMPLTAMFVTETDAFSLDEGKISAKDVTGFHQVLVKLANGVASRTLKLTKTGALLPGNGTSESPYVIASAEDFNKISDYATDNSFGFPGYHFIVTQDLDFSDVAMKPLGHHTVFFDGIFDGGGHSFIDVVVDRSEEENADAVAIFPYLGQEGVIKNLTVDSSTFKGGNQVASISAHCMGVIENCRTGKDVEVEGVSGLQGASGSGNEIGGIVGRMYPTSTVYGCENSAVVTGNTMVGGISGSSRDMSGALISGCRNYGKITGTAPREVVIQGGQEVAKYVETMAGGIAGRFTGTLQDCANEGEVSSTVCNAVGGIIGKAFIEASIKGCTNRGRVYVAYSYGGGIVGITSVNSGREVSTLIDDCSNEGEVSGMASVGGIAGVAANGCAIKRSWNIGEIKPMMGRSGGIVGEVSQYVTIEESYNTGDISASMLAGGIVGDAPQYSDLSIARCFNTGDVTAGNNGGASGIANVTAGKNGSVAVSDSYNNGDISAARFVAGISGRSDGVKISRCYSSGGIICTSANSAFRQSVGSIAGDPSSSPVIENCCYLDINENLAADSHFDASVKLKAEELFASSGILGEAYVFNAGALSLPMLSVFGTEDAAKANAVYFTFEGSDTASGVSNEVMLGTLEGTEWSVTGPFVIEDGVLVPTGSGEGVLTATAGSFSKSYTFNSVKGSGIEELMSGSADSDLNAIYYDVSGMKTDKNHSKGAVLIKVVTDSEGNRRAEKVFAE